MRDGIFNLYMVCSYTDIMCCKLNYIYNALCFMTCSMHMKWFIDKIWDSLVQKHLLSSTTWMSKFHPIGIGEDGRRKQ